MYWSPRWFINDYKPGILVMVDDFDGSGGNRRFVTMDFVGDTVSVSDNIRLVNDFSVDCD
jgi:hypothetical protein